MINAVMDKELPRVLSEEDRQQNALKMVIERFNEYGVDMKKCWHQKGGPDARRPMEIAQELGYRVKFQQLGTGFLNTHREPDILSEDNSARIGVDKNGQPTLFVGLKKDGYIFDLEDYYHDINTIIFGGKMSPNKKLTTSRVDPDFLAKIVKWSCGADITIEEMNAIGLLDKNDLVASNYLMDALVFGRLKPEALKYLELVRFKS